MSVSRKSLCLFYRQIECQHAVDTCRWRPARRTSRPPSATRVGVAEDDDRRGDVRPDVGDQRQGRRKAAASGQRPLGCALNDRAVGEGIGKRHANFEDVGSRPSSARRISADRGRSGSPAVVYVTRPASFGAEPSECLIDARDGHVFVLVACCLPRAFSTVFTSLSPRPDRFTRIVARRPELLASLFA